MFNKYLIFFMIFHSTLSQRSLTLVVDTTGSMRVEIDILKNSIGRILHSIQREDLAQYILLTFGDQDVDPPLVSSNPTELLDIMQFMQASEGEDCIENSLAAIEKALQVSLPRSFIYVFTDAQASKYVKLDSIKKLCQQQKSQVVIFQSGGCDADSLDQIDRAYYEITRSCGGSMFHVNEFNVQQFRETLKYIKEITEVDWTAVTTHEEFRNHKEIPFFVDDYTKDFIICISGKYPRLEISNNFGDNVKYEKIVDTSNMLVARVPYSDLDEGACHVYCQGPAIATFYIKKEIDFKYGFSTLPPGSFEETAPTPIPNTVNYILIQMQQVLGIELRSVFVQTDKREANKAELQVLNEDKGLYMAKIFIEPEKSFKIKIECRVKANFEEIIGTTSLLAPQTKDTSSQYSSPTLKILKPESPLVDFGSSYIMACKVKGYPMPDIWWENNMGEILPSESGILELSSTYISHLNIANVTKNETVICKCKNSEGQDEMSMDLYVKRNFTFDVIQYPEETTIEYGKEFKLHCEVNAYPEAEIKWYHNGTLVEDTDEIHIKPDEHLLLIEKMGVEHTGEYQCVISNGVETKSFAANVYITGLEAPEVQLEDLEVVLKPGDFTEQQCSVIKGIPIPEVTWKYKSNDGDLHDLPEGVVVDDTSLKIPSANTNHGGFYVCEAVNLLGADNQEVAVKIQYAPKIKNTEEEKEVDIGDLVKLVCEVDAVPKANVHWTMYRDDVIIPFDDRHQTDNDNTHRFTANASDSGIYHCVAENDMGTNTKTITLNVLVPPYIEDLNWETLRVRQGMTVVLPCNVLYGNPEPSIRWQSISPTFETTVLSRGTGRLDLALENITRHDEGTYQCVAENKVALDTVRVHLKVV